MPVLETEEVSELEATLDHFGMLELLKNHFGDGSIYVSNGASAELLELAKEHGYVNEEGYLTRAGRKLVTEHRLHKNL